MNRPGRTGAALAAIVLVLAFVLWLGYKAWQS